VLEELEYQQEEEDTNFGYVVDNEKTFHLAAINSSQKKATFKRDKPNVITSEHVKQMGLDPYDDRDFLTELIRFYDFNLVM
jgi:hypothetical protein